MTNTTQLIQSAIDSLEETKSTRTERMVHLLEWVKELSLEFWSNNEQHNN